MKKVKSIAVLKAFLKKSYSYDLRALSLMRIGLALVILSDLIIRCSDFTAHYTEAGVWPREMLSQGWKSGYWTFHALSTQPAYVAVLFSLQFLVALSFLIGFRSQISAFILFIFYVSLHNRNIFILQAGDDLLRLVILACVFLPVGARYSIDNRNKRPIRQSTIGFLSYLLLISSVYIFTVLLKSGPDWRQNFDAVYYALNLSQLRLPFGDWLLLHPSLHKPLTLLVLILEIVIPILILWPSSKKTSRLIAFFLITFLHISFGSSLYVGLFWIICIVSSIGLLPEAFMNKVEKILHLKQVNTDTLALPSRAAAITVFLITCISFANNLSTLKEVNYELTSPLTEVVNAMRMDQYWGMFSPGILRNDGYLVYHGMDSIGRQWDLRRDQDYVDYHEPPHVVDMYKNDRWRKWAENMQDNRFTFLRPLYCQYIIRSFNKVAKKRKVKLLKLYWLEKITPPPGSNSKHKEILYCICNED